MVDVLIVYDTTTGHTEKAAGEIRRGVEASGASVEVKRAWDATVEDVKGAKGVILGSPCIVDNYSGRLRDFVETRLKLAKPDAKVGAAFGTYKWKGGNLKRLEDDMRWMGIKLVADGVNLSRYAGDDGDRRLRDLGRKVGDEARRAA